LTDKTAFWGIDIGGTYAKIGCIVDGVFRMVETLPTGENCEPKKLLHSISNLVLGYNAVPAALGLGTAGLVDRSSGGTIIFSPNLPLWNNVKAGSILENTIGIPVVVDNDCNAFAIGAISSGLIPSQGLWLLVALGTGIGGTIINHGIVQYGTGYSGEFGHMTVKEGGIPCPCGSNGCWERYAGKKALEWYYTTITGKKLSPLEMSLSASNGNLPAKEAFREYGRWVGLGLANLARCFSPMGFFLAGGLSAATDHFKKAALQEYTSRCVHPWKVTVLEDSPNAGAFGAASMAVLRC
jgi:glucokinase